MPLVSTLPGPAAYADDAGKDIDCSAVTDDSTTTGPLHTSLPSKPDDAMNVEAAWQFLRQYGHQKNPGQGVTVAVLDSGVRTDGTGIPVVDRAAAGTPGPVVPRHRRRRADRRATGRGRHPDRHRARRPDLRRAGL